MEKHDRKHDEKHKHDQRDEEREHRPHGTGYGREQAVYFEYLTRRWQGSKPPSAQAYMLALHQLHQLPGSVVTSGTDLGKLVPTHPAPPKSKHKH